MFQNPNWNLACNLYKQINEDRIMKKIFTLILLSFLISCKSYDSGNKDIKLNPVNGDTLEVIKRYPSNKILEIIKYKDNQPNSNLCYTETDEKIDYPKLIHIIDKKSLYAYIPIEKKYTDVYIEFESLEDRPSVPRLILHDIKKSTEFPINVLMVDKNKIVGVIKCKSENNSLTFYSFHIYI